MNNPIPEITLLRGEHLTPKGEPKEACIMELVSYVAGEPWSDHPECVSPVITGAAISLNDTIDDGEWRTELLRPLTPRMIGTRDENDLARSYIALDWLVRTYVPVYLRLVPEISAIADDLENLPDITGPETFGTKARDLLQRASDAARDAARDATWAAVSDAARDAARAATWAAARAATRDAARSATWAAAWTATRAAVSDAASEVMRETAKQLQSSFAECIGRMCDVGRDRFADGEKQAKP